MSTVIPVRFAYAARDLWFDPKETGAQEGDHLICSTERGTEIGLATAPPREVTSSELGNKTGNAILKPVLRVASEGDLVRAERLALQGDEALPVFRRLVEESGLDMKPVGVEYLFGRERVVCYFAAAERVDFRQLVRNLSHELHERIDMRQIGVREEAAVVGGYGHCGQELCCARIGLSFEPVSIRMAKEQDLPLTSNKISGACGRLMCCLRYEFEAYRDFKGRAPKRNAVIDTPLGKAKIVEYDTPKEQLALRLENGKVRRIPLSEMLASDAAKKKSEELHCPCRPDTVVRESLDKLNSPDVQMALAELDRKMGIVQEDQFDSTDLFVEPKPRKRKSHRGSEQSGQVAAQADNTAKLSRRTRRRRVQKATSEGAEQQVQQAQQKSVAEDATKDEKRTRRRRRRRSGSGTAAAAGIGAQTQAKQGGAGAQNSTPKNEKASEGQASSRRRRRHRSENGQGQGQGQNQGQGQVQQQGTKGSQQQGKPRRRPGDRGGHAGQQQSAKETKPSAEGAAPKRRRRRRSGRGRGGNGGGKGDGQPTKAE